MTHYITSPQPIQRILADLRRAPSVGFDLETTGLDPHTAKIRLLTLADAPNAAGFEGWRVIPASPPLLAARRSPGRHLPIRGAARKNDR